MSHFYETEFDIWADFGPVGNTETGPIKLKYATFEGSFHWQKKYFLKNIVSSALKKLHNIKVRKLWTFVLKFK